jgi:LPPG:FO 2-phospho-L-lactate transferase
MDEEDVAYAQSVRSLGIQVAAVNTVMRTIDDRVELARAVLEFARAIREGRLAEAQ